ncbi:MAG: YwqG family protein [Sodalinema sp.]|uniref:DUF1963 domain-containing protein n=1 Tax=Sodalinema sp. TaxID=3080550 RepID=UPI001219F44D|nr:MAG: DUF1963 domain-containing protein [Phormidium sp. SL48-SHIP]
MKNDDFLADLPPEFAPLKAFLQDKFVPYIQINLQNKGWLQKTAQQDPLALWSSKMGGYPYLPKALDYPRDAETGELMMFLLQINCAEVPEIPNFPLPRQGLLQFFVGLNVPMCELSPQQHRIRYIEEIDRDETRLVTNFEFTQETRQHNEWYDHIYGLDFSQGEALFLDYRYSMGHLPFPEALAKLCDELGFEDWWSDYRDESPEPDIPCQLAGYPDLHSDVPDLLEDAQGQLLLEVQDPFACSDYFYFFINPDALKRQDFTQVESYFLRV